MYCSACGSRLNEDAVFCHTCGAKQASSQSLATIPLSPLATQSAYACPLCGQDGYVQKVSSVIGAGTSSGIMFGMDPRDKHLDGRGKAFGAAKSAVATGNQSLLAQRLNPPAQPVLQKPWDAGKVIAMFLVLIFAFGAFLNGSVVMGVILLALIAAWAARLYLIWFKLEDQHEEDILRWQNKLRQWNGLFYCHRCDGVFVHGDRTITPITQMYSLLERRAEIVSCRRRRHLVL